MTAELIIMNKSGIALAADSAVTVSSHGTAQKVYNTANKLFSLSKYEPVGIMTYDNAEIMGIPWEIVIKRFRDKMGNCSHKKLESYIEEFFQFLKKDAFDQVCIENYVRRELHATIKAVLGIVEEQTNEILDKKKNPSEKDLEETSKRVFGKLIDEISKKKDVKNLDENQIKERTEEYSGLIDELVKNELKPFPFTKQQVEAFSSVCLYLTVLGPTRTRSGIVFAGYGTEEYFPTAHAFTISRVINEEIDMVDDDREEISFSNPALLRAFAQSNETNSFMRGISDRMNKYLRKDVKKVFDNFLGENLVDMLVDDGILDNNKREDCAKKLKKMGGGIFSFLADSIDKYSFAEFTRPVIDAVQFLSPKDMATMAETLVNLESFRQQVSLNHETVGGPIDIAVITKGDGFIWIKRKHYFERDYNHQFFSNYYNTHE